MAIGQLTFDFMGSGAGDYPAPLLTAIEELAERGDLKGEKGIKPALGFLAPSINMHSLHEHYV